MTKNSGITWRSQLSGAIHPVPSLAFSNTGPARVDGDAHHDRVEQDHAEDAERPGRSRYRCHGTRVAEAR